MTLRHTISLLLTALTMGMTSCSDDFDTKSEGQGTLRLALADICTQTRSTPAQIGVPAPSDFMIAVTNNVGREVYAGPFTTDEITLPVGEYNVTASYGDNDLLAVDKPYYVASQTVQVVPDDVTEVSLTATVGNALVSAVFGIDEAERQRFDRFYTDYALYVGVGNFSIPITKDNPAKSVYVREGSDVTLRFWGKLKLENDREVQTQLASTTLPATLNAADHAIITLTLPDPESALNVAIAKVDMQVLTLDETIPLSWLPVAMVMPMHQYDAKGNLVGTNLIITESYPDMKWRAVITNAAGTTVRAIEGKGALSSDWNKNTTWPYLPKGNYKATYYIVADDGTATMASSRDFTVPAPDIRVTVGGYTSYSKYLEGDIEAANACDRLTVYEPSAKLNVSQALLVNANYPYSFTYTYDGATGSVPAGVNNYAPGDLTEQAVQREPHVLRIDATFDGVSATDQTNLIITGLPYSLDLKNHDEWDTSGGVDWFDNDVRLGHLSTGSQYIQTTSAICMPPATYFCADYSINVHTLTVGTYFTISAGQTEMLRYSEAGTPFRDTDHLYSGTTGIFHDDGAYINTIRCYNDYGAGQTCSHVYSLTFKYAAH